MWDGNGKPHGETCPGVSSLRNRLPGEEGGREGGRQGRRESQADATPGPAQHWYQGNEGFGNAALLQRGLAGGVPPAPGLPDLVKDAHGQLIFKGPFQPKPLGESMKLLTQSCSKSPSIHRPVGPSIHPRASCAPVALAGRSILPLKALPLLKR